MSIHLQALVVAFLFTSWLILVYYQFSIAKTTNLSQGTGAEDEISHESFVTPYDEDKVPFTNLSDSATKVKREFWKSHKASYKCPPSLLSRVGKETGDGGKWMCGLKTFGRLTTDEQYPCVFYSFGVGGESYFESEVLQTTTCSVYAYDIKVRKIGRPLKPSNPRVHFQKMGVAGHAHNNSTMKTLKTLMDENGHSFIDILKMDIESWEYDTFNKLFDDFPTKLPFAQLMIELHQHRSWTLEGAKKVLGLVEKLERRGCRVFSIEPNIYSIDACSEFSFINLHYRRLFIPDDI